MAAKLNTTKRISLQNGSQGKGSSGPTVPRQGGLRGGGQGMAQLGTGGKSGGGMAPNTGGGFGTSRGLQKGKC